MTSSPRLCAAALGLLLLAGCRSKSGAESDTLSATVERGPLKLTVEATPRQVLIGDAIKVELRVETPNDYLVRFPDKGDLGEGAAVRNVETPDQQLAAKGGLLWRRTLTVDLLSAGNVTIPPLAVEYARKPAQVDAQPVFDHQLESKPLQIEVSSALTAKDSVSQPRDITGTLTPPRKPLSPLAWALIIGGLIVGVTALVLLIRWVERLARRPAPPIPAEVWALRALGELETMRLIESGQAREYYYRLSEIVRIYVERQFGLAAPEMTTEEFLGTLARNRGALPYDAERLRDFLQACDLVKYAALSPRPQDADQALGSARAFIDATAAARRGQGPVGEEAEPQRGGYAA